MRRLRYTAALMVTALAALAACSSGSGHAAPAPSSTALTEAQILALGKEVANCVRQNGVPGFPDPYYQDAKLQLPPIDSAMEQQMQAALEGPCKALWTRLEAVLAEQENGGRRDDQPRGPMSAENLGKLQQYTQCMREHGFPTWPDPDATGFYHVDGSGLPEGLGKGERPIDATFREALKTCEPYAVPGMGLGR
jgi:hypothetical protein